MCFDSSSNNNLAMIKMQPSLELQENYCCVCKKQFQAAWLKQQHDANEHHGSQLFKCLFDACNKTFDTAGKLTRHSKTHLKGRKLSKCYSSIETSVTVAVSGHNDSYLNEHSQIALPTTSELSHCLNDGDCNLRLVFFYFKTLFLLSFLHRAQQALVAVSFTCLLKRQPAAATAAFGWCQK
jgi:hypothetical protein